MTTLLELRTRVRTQSRDENAAYITDTDIDTWLNEAYIDLAARLELIQNEVTGTTSGSAYIGLPPGVELEVLRPLSLRFEDDDVEFVDETTFYAYVDSASTPAHSIGIVFQGLVQVYPVPETGTAYVLRYAASPTPLTGDSDVPLLPTHLHARMVRFGEAQMFYKLDDVPRGDRAMAQFEDGLPGPALGMDKLTPGPFTLQFEAGPFDLDPEARHI